VTVTTPVMTDARLVETRVPRNPEGVVLVLHGGASRGEGVRVSPTQLSVLRMVPIAARIAARSRGRLAVFRLLNAVRGWDASHTPVQDVRWALGEIARRFGELPAALVGHSLGGRAAILSSGAEPVRAVAALNPWVYPHDGRVETSGREFLIVHGTDDRVAEADRSFAAAELLRRGNSVGYVRVTGGKHAMLRRHQVFDSLAADFAVRALLGAGGAELVDRAMAASGPITV
jgi:pimeloyl-ACP methyl ester carboxylesterase